jgi:hypothetical protein
VAGVSFAIYAPDAPLLAASLIASPAKVRAKLVRSTRHHAQLLLTRIQANASGRPGPNAPTGDYRRSWTLVFSPAGSVAGGPVALVGTNKPQGRRLEFGFVGADALGRYYNQPPYPHVRPAVDEVEPRFVADVERIVDEEIK